MAVFKKTVTAYRCERCEHEWIPRSKVNELPTVCPKCKSPYWNEPKKKGDKKRVEKKAKP